MSKIGIFGGAFNPVHNGHVNLILQVKEKCNLDKILIIPTLIPPHKDEFTISFEDRMNMCELAFNNIVNLEISDVEREIEGKNYTIKTLNKLIEKNSSDEYNLIIGGDSLLSFEKWYKYEEILSKCKLIAAARNENQFQLLLEKRGIFVNCTIVEIDVLEISSTQIRNILKSGGSASEYLPDKVYCYIKDKNLYI